MISYWTGFGLVQMDAARLLGDGTTRTGARGRRSGNSATGMKGSTTTTLASTGLPIRIAALFLCLSSSRFSVTRATVTISLVGL